MESFLDKIINARCCQDGEKSLASCMKIGEDGCTISELFPKENEKQQKENEKQQIPEPLEDQDLQKLNEICEEYLKFVVSPEYYEDNDYDHYIFEKALKTVYGDDIFNFINENTK
jgi:hypothetical protein